MGGSIKLVAKDTIIPLIIALPFFMTSVDSTVINTAIPAMAESLQVEPVDLKVALVSYLLSLAIFIPISGWMADKWGAKRIFILALWVFTLSSLWCGLANSLVELVIARFIQGFGGALSLPVGRLILVRIFGIKNLIVVMSRVITISALGLMLGPVIGGFITEHFSWHWIFLINIPFGIFSILLAMYWLDDSTPQEVPSLDKVGFILFGTALGGLSFGLSALSETTISSVQGLVIILFSLLVLLTYFRHSNKQDHPIVKTSLLSIRTFRVAAAGNLFSRLGFGGVPFLLPLLLQIGFGYSPLLSGLLLAPTAIGISLSRPLALPLLRNLGYKRVLIWNTFLAGASIWSLALIGPQTPAVIIALLTFIFGFLVSIQYSAMNSLGYADISGENLSAANSIISTLQQLAQSVGVAVSAIFIRLFSYGFSENLELSPFVFKCTFIAIGIFTLFSAFVFIDLKQDDGKQMIL